MRGLRDRGGVNIWPGFVDALANILIVMTVVLLLFFVVQVYLGDTLSGQSREIDDLRDRLDLLGEELRLEQVLTGELRESSRALEASLASSEEEGFRLRSELEGLRVEKARVEEGLLSQVRTLEVSLAAGGEREKALGEELALIKDMVGGLRRQLLVLNEALEASERRDEESQATIKALGQRLNVALAGKVQELSTYRSDFFGRVRKLLQDKEGIRIVGDRFVFSSEVLFETGSSDLEEAGKDRVGEVARTVIELSKTIPPDINWILQVEGHTDDVPIDTEEFASNWELSSARAVSVVRFLISEGVEPHRLSTAGYAEYQPVERWQEGEDRDRIRLKNRRIELRLTQH